MICFSYTQMLFIFINNGDSQPHAVPQSQRPPLRITHRKFHLRHQQLPLLQHTAQKDILRRQTLPTTPQKAQSQSHHRKKVRGKHLPTQTALMQFSKRIQRQTQTRHFPFEEHCFWRPLKETAHIGKASDLRVRRGDTLWKLARS